MTKVLLAGLLIAHFAIGQDQHGTSAKPVQKSEVLRYNVNWPSGLSLGEGQLTANQKEEGWSYRFEVEASVPGFALKETAEVLASLELCSTKLVKTATRGKRTVNETTTFDQKNLKATRETGKGGKSEISISACAKDALTYLFYVRKELAAGRLPQAQDVYYGAAYRVRVQHAGAQQVRIGDKFHEADRLQTTIKGPAAQVTFDMFFARDAARTPLLVQVPLPLGKFSLELAR